MGNFGTFFGTFCRVLVPAPNPRIAPPPPLFKPRPAPSRICPSPCQHISPNRPTSPFPCPRKPAESLTGIGEGPNPRQRDPSPKAGKSGYVRVMRPSPMEEQKVICHRGSWFAEIAERRELQFVEHTQSSSSAAFAPR